MKTVLAFLCTVLGITVAGCGGGQSAVSGPPPRSSPAILVSDNQSGAVVVVDANTDLIIRTVTVASPGKMASAGGTTVIQSTLSNSIAVFDNASLTIRFTVPLPALPVDLALSSDGAIAWVAESNGTVQNVSTASGTVTGTVTESGVQRLVMGPQGTRLFALNDSLTIFVPFIVTATTSPVSLGNSGLDHPTLAIFGADDNNLFILSCGPECGGTSANVTGAVMNTPGGPFISNPLAVSGATMGLLSGNSLFIAGSPAAGLNAGTLQVMNVQAFTAGAPVSVADGRHLNMALTSNGRLYVGSRGCTAGPVNAQNQRQGCLTIFDTAAPAVAPVLLPASRPNGDVTGLAPISGRNVIYVVQGGKLDLFDITTNAVSTSAIPPNIPGKAFDAVLLKP